MLELFVLALAGCALGAATGLVPGLHVNTLAVLGFSLYLSLGLDPLAFTVVLTATSITHAFVSFIPAILLGAPQEDTALSVLPAHRLFLEGKSLEAVKLTAIGSVYGLGLSIILLVPAFYIIPPLYSALRGVIAYVLMAAVVFLLLKEGNRRRIFWACVVFFMSGCLGFLVLNRQDVLSSGEILFPVFAGLFGISNLLESLRSKTAYVPQERFAPVKLERRFLGAGILGTLGGAIIGVLPAVSPSQMGILLSEAFALEARSFLVFLAAINASDAVYSLLALYTINNPRSGVAVIVGKMVEIDFDVVLLLVGVMACVAFFSAYLHIELGRRMGQFIGRISYRALCTFSMLLMLALVYAFSGFFGLCVCLLASAIGLLPILAGVSRTHLMGVLLLPTIIFFLRLGLA